MRRIFLSISLLFSLLAAAQSEPLSLAEAIVLARSYNTSLAIANEESRIVAAQSKELNALWYPSVTIAGEYTHSLSEIAAVTSIGALAGGAIENLEPLLASNPTLLGIVEEVAATPIRLPLVPRNTASVGVEVGWALFSGGRRIQASKISKALSGLSSARLSIAESAVDFAVVREYFAARLAEEVVLLRESELSSLSDHLRHARSLEREGMIVPAERLTAEVAVEQARVSLVAARGDSLVAHRALLATLNANYPALVLTTPLFMPPSLPTKEQLYALVECSPTLGALRQQTAIATHSLNAERGRYLPTIALLGHQQLWSTGLDKNLFPRTALGVGLSWTLFDGLAREGAVARSRAQVATAEIAEERVADEMRLTIDRLYSALMAGRAEYEVACTTERLAEELARSRRRAFGEGMATSSEVVDAEVLLTGARVAQMVALCEIDVALCSLLMVVGTTDEFLDYMRYEE